MSAALSEFAVYATPQALDALSALPLLRHCVCAAMALSLSC
jgi:hypothetical protein